ncbi:MAG: hypothetical protein ACYDDF_04520 [Thermoplasmatota archaeon]
MRGILWLLIAGISATAVLGGAPAALAKPWCLEGQSGCGQGDLACTTLGSPVPNQCVIDPCYTTECTTGMAPPPCPVVGPVGVSGVLVAGAGCRNFVTVGDCVAKTYYVEGVTVTEGVCYYTHGPLPRLLP